ncbi:MAG: copper amine oxidase N-terminal domain-containing protein, partial [Candidatus Baltobacteraceae bacterium]
PAAERPTRAVTIVVNGEPLATGTPPQVVGGRLLLPLRDVFSALGIAVDRDGDRISGQLPTGNITVVIGSARAYVDGKTLALDAPAVEIDGTAYVPLRLLTAALGAQVSYDQRGAKVEIVSLYVGRNSGAESARADGGTDVQGVVSAVDTSSRPCSITVLRGGEARTVSVDSDARIYVVDVTIHSQLRLPLASIRIGDALHAILDRDGRVVSVYDFFKSTSGTVTATSASAIVLESGRVVIPSGSTEITLDGAQAVLDALEPGDYVTVRSNPETGELRQIIGSRPAAKAAAAPQASGALSVAVASFGTSATHPLRAGETFGVTLVGTPGGRASFDIGDYLTGIEMREQSPGTYVGQFTIPDRFNVTQVPLYGHLSVADASAPRAEAAQALSAATTPPVIGEIAPPPGQGVNNPRPSIFATYAAPTGIAIDPASVLLLINGRDVTPSATRTSAFITYSPGFDLSDEVTVTVRVADAAGNTASRSWSFSVKR